MRHYSVFLAKCVSSAILRYDKITTLCSVMFDKVYHGEPIFCSFLSNHIDVERKVKYEHLPIYGFLHFLFIRNDKLPTMLIWDVFTIYPRYCHSLFYIFKKIEVVSYHFLSNLQYRILLSYFYCDCGLFPFLCTLFFFLYHSTV